MTPASEAARDDFGLIFNVGSRRSGTYWLQRIVSAHSDVAEVPSETHLYSDGFAPLFERFQHADPASPTVATTYLERERLIAATRELALASFAHARTGSEPFVAERTPFHVRHLPLIAELHPEARFVHIIRDGRDVARSLTLHDWGPETVAEAATEWRDSVAAGRAAGLGPDRYREVRFERLRQNPEDEIAELYAWLGLSSGPDELGAALAAAEKRRNSAPGSDGKIGSGLWRSAWSESELAEFAATAGELLAELGYETAATDPVPELDPAPMASFWDARAKENAYYFNNIRLGYAASDPDAFWASGPSDLDALLGALGLEIAPEDDVVEIGCGIGRMTRPLAARGKSVRAVDVSAGMLERARTENPDLERVSWIQGDGRTLAAIETASADVCISYVVFQHLPETELTLGYVTEIGRVLRSDGWAAFQISNDSDLHENQSSAGIGNRLRVRLGQAPGGQQDPAWVGSAVDLGELRATAETAGLEIERIENPGTQFCVVHARRR